MSKNFLLKHGFALGFILIAFVGLFYSLILLNDYDSLFFYGCVPLTLISAAFAGIAFFLRKQNRSNDVPKRLLPFSKKWIFFFFVVAVLATNLFPVDVISLFPAFLMDGIYNYIKAGFVAIVGQECMPIYSVIHASLSYSIFYYFVSCVYHHNAVMTRYIAKLKKDYPGTARPNS